MLGKQPSVIESPQDQVCDLSSGVGKTRLKLAYVYILWAYSFSVTVGLTSKTIERAELVLPPSASYQQMIGEYNLSLYG